MRVRKNVLFAVGGGVVVSCSLLAYSVTRYRQDSLPSSFAAEAEQQSASRGPEVWGQQPWRVPYADDLDGDWTDSAYSASGVPLNYVDFVKRPSVANGEQQALAEPRAADDKR